jgi:hypothetical protein
VIAGSTRAEDGLFLGMASYLPLLVEGKPLSLALREVQYTQGLSPISLFVVILDDVGIYGLIRKEQRVLLTMEALFLATLIFTMVCCLCRR